MGPIGWFSLNGLLTPLLLYVFPLRRGVRRQSLRDHPMGGLQAMGLSLSCLLSLTTKKGIKDVVKERRLQR